MGLPTSREIVIAIKQARLERGYSITRIEEELLRKGKPISSSSLKRVFKDRSEEEASSFSYEHIILPLTEVLPEVWLMLDRGEPQKVNENADLKMELRVQAAILESKLEQIKILEDRVAFMKEQVAILKTQVELKDRRMDEKDRAIRELQLRLEAMKNEDS